MQIQATYKEVVSDAQIMASIFYNMKSGMDTWHHVFIALESKFNPFLGEVFKDEFYKSITKRNEELDLERGEL